MIRVRYALCVIVAVVLAAGAVPATGAAGRRPRSKLDAVLHGGVAGPLRVIVRTRGGNSTAAHLRRGAAILKQHALINAVTLSIQASDLAALEADDDVDSVSLDMAVTGSAAPGGASAAGGRNRLMLATLGLPVRGITGQGVGVAVIDSGLSPNEDFSDYAFFDFTAPLSPNAYDDYGHGTHVSGLIASNGALSPSAGGPRYPGVAPGARIISLKVLDAQGIALTSTVIDAIEFAIAKRRALGIDVINLSLGHPILEPAATDPLVQAVEAAVRAGIVVVVSAGNVGRNVVTGERGYAGILSPANAPSAITVGAFDTRHTATRSDDAVPAYSSRGPTWYDAEPKPDLVAPGQSLVSDAAPGASLYMQLPNHRVGVGGSPDPFFRLSGTSMSAAVTSGVVALMIEANRRAHGPALTPRTIKEILGYTAIPLDGYDALTQGHGGLNGAGAVAVAAAIDAGTPVRRWWTARLPAPRTTIHGEACRWAETFLFPGGVVWGNDRAIPAWAQTIVWGNNIIGDTIVWGNAGGDTIVWGNNSYGDTIVWGNTVASGDTIVWGNTIAWGHNVGPE